MIFKIEPFCDMDIKTQVGTDTIFAGEPFVINTKNIVTISQYREGDISGIKINGVKIPLYDSTDASYMFCDIEDMTQKENKVEKEWDKNYFNIEKIFNQIVNAMEKEQTNEK